MAGIDNITNEILQEAKDKAAAVIAEAKKSAEKERENIAFRLNQGRRLAIEKGVKMGRPGGSVKSQSKLAAEYASVIKLLKRGQSVRNTAKICGVSASTVQRVKKSFNL